MEIIWHELLDLAEDWAAASSTVFLYCASALYATAHEGTLFMYFDPIHPHIHVEYYVLTCSLSAINSPALGFQNSLERKVEVKRRETESIEGKKKNVFREDGSGSVLVADRV